MPRSGIPARLAAVQEATASPTELQKLPLEPPPAASSRTLRRQNGGLLHVMHSKVHKNITEIAFVSTSLSRSSITIWNRALLISWKSRAADHSNGLKVTYRLTASFPSWRTNDKACWLGSWQFTPSRASSAWLSWQLAARRNRAEGPRHGLRRQSASRISSQHDASSTARIHYHPTSYFTPLTAFTLRRARDTISRPPQLSHSLT